MQPANVIKAIFLFPDRTNFLVIPLMFKEKNGKSDKLGRTGPKGNALVARLPCRGAMKASGVARFMFLQLRFTALSRFRKARRSW
jgi:hypothetical protein